MRYPIRIALFSLFLTISGCGEQQFDSSDPYSLEKMMSGMSLQEQAAFIKDSELVIHALGGGIGEEGFGDPAYKLNGYTVKQIREEAENVRAFIREKNIKFLREKINEMQTSGKSSIRLHRTVDGIFSPPRMGYIAKDYYLEALKAILLQLSPDDKGLEVSVDTKRPASDSNINSIRADDVRTKKFSDEQDPNSIIIPEPASECDENYEKALESAGLVVEVIPVHGPEDSDFSGYGCPYRITPAPGTKVQAGSKVTFRSAWESG